MDVLFGMKLDKCSTFRLMVSTVIKIVLRLTGVESTLNVVGITIFTKSCCVQVKTLVVSAMQTEFIMNAMGEGYIINMCGSF